MISAYGKQTDEKWQKKWEETGLYRYTETADREKLYLLEMFSYPSASKLHLGHWWNYSLPDSWGRMKHMQGYNVFHPMGFDAFGLPAENFAIKTGIHPKDSTENNIATMEQQLREIGCTYDWDYELVTCRADYYKWTQWLFLQLYKHDLAYRKEALINWCPKCMTVLANEQAAGGECERCHSQVSRKSMTQWFFKITDYAEQLLDGLSKLDWPEKTKRIQENWIGRSIGAELVIPTEQPDRAIHVFTTRADTLMGLTYVVLAPESELVSSFVTPEYAERVAAYCDAAMRKTDIDRSSTTTEKTGVFTGSYALHPVTGEKLPIWVADYVIASYGTGAVMAVPGHDERDYDFAIKYKLPIQEVIVNKKRDSVLPYCEYGELVNSGKYDGLSSEEAKTAIVADLAVKEMGKQTINYRLRDWSVSRQRYWGAPIPMVHCAHCGVVPVDEKDLPVELPYNVAFSPSGQSPLQSSEEFLRTACPKCGKPAVREADTLDTFVCSSWYHLRYIDNKNTAIPFDTEKANRLMPVDKYVGGVEHAAMHLLYARFIHKALRDMGYLKGDEPYASLVHQGIILGADGNKMSKSLGNTVAPDLYINQYGSDIFRMYLAFGFSYIEGGPWNDNGIKSMARFFARFTRMVEDFVAADGAAPYAQDADTEFVRHSTIKAVTHDMEIFQFNTAVARLMEFCTAIIKYQGGDKRSKAYERELVEDFIRLASPLMPHFAEELWESIGGAFSVYNQPWPVCDESKLQLATVEIGVQVNGIIRDKLTVPADLPEEQTKEQALALERIQERMGGKAPKKVIYIKGRLVNIVV